MQQVTLMKEMVLPSNSEELDNESRLDKHERWLRTLILNKFTPLYIGDTVRVSKRWAGDAQNPYEGKIGVITDIQAGMQAAFNIDYLVYNVKTPEGEALQTYHYTLDRTYQPAGNQMLEKMLRETNAAFEARFK